MHTKRVQQNSKTLEGVHGVALYLRVLCGLEASSAGFLNMSEKIGWYLSNMSHETAKFLCSFSIFILKSCGILAMSAQAMLFVMNSIKERLQRLNRRVSETQLPCTLVPDLPTVGVVDFLQATYSAHPIQWIWSPWNKRLVLAFWVFIYLFIFYKNNLNRGGEEHSSPAFCKDKKERVALRWALYVLYIVRSIGIPKLSRLANAQV